MYYIKYIWFLTLSTLGNPFYQMISYIICKTLYLGSSKGTNVFQANSIAMFIILILIFLIRLNVYKKKFTSIEYPFSANGSNSFLYIFAQRHNYQFIGLLSFPIWLLPLEGNIIGFIIFPLTLLLGSTVSLISFIRLLKTKEILMTKNKPH